MESTHTQTHVNDGNRNRRRHGRLGVFPVADRDEAEHCCEQQSDAAEERAQGGPEENAYKPFETKTTEEVIAIKRRGRGGTGLIVVGTG